MASAEGMAANGGYEAALKQTAAGAGVLKAVQPSEKYVPRPTDRACSGRLAIALYCADLAL